MLFESYLSRMKIRQSRWSLLVLCVGTLHGQEAIFVPNQGQWEGEFQYKLPLKYGALFFEKGAVQMVLRDAGQIEDLRGHHMHEAGLSLPVDPLRTYAVRMKFIDAEPSESRGTHETGYYHNYFLGEDQSRWKGGVRPHDELVYENLYPTTKLKFYGKDNHLKYDWHLSDPEVLSQIKWTYDGATGVQLNPEGSLQIQTSICLLYTSDAADE